MADEGTELPGTPGASASRKGQRLREQRESKNANRTRLGRLAAALFPSDTDKRLRREEHNWTTGAQGERILASYLAGHCTNLLMLHDRRAPQSRGNIDHIAIAPSGIYVIDCKRYKGKIEVAEPLFGKAKLKIKGRDQTKLIDGLDKQVARVKLALAEVASDVPAHGCLCFVAPEGILADTGLPALRTLRINGYPLYSPRRLAKQLNRAGPLSTDRARALQAELAAVLPQAAHS
jgi:hypothetical protein